MAKQWRKESIEEMEHADKLVVRIIFSRRFPESATARSLPHRSEHVKRCLTATGGGDFRPHALPRSRDVLPRAQDYVTRDLFEKLMADEVHHIDFLETQLDLVDKLGLELYAQNHIGKMGEGDD